MKKRIFAMIIAVVLSLSMITTVSAQGVHIIDNCNLITSKSISDAEGCIDIFTDISLSFPCNIPKTSAEIQSKVSRAIEDYTSIIVKNVNIYVKSLEI